MNCNKCNKLYQSLWNHNKIYNGNPIKNKINNDIVKQIKCKYCNKIFNTRQNK